MQWRKQRELSALSAEALNGYAQAQSQLQRLSAQLDALDERKGRYLTGSGTKNGGVRHPAVVKGAAAGRTASATGRAKQTGEISPTLLTQIDTRLNQLLNRYVILLDTKVEQSPVNIGDLCTNKGYVTLLFLKGVFVYKKERNRPFDLLVDSHQIMSVYFGR